MSKILLLLPVLFGGCAYAASSINGNEGVVIVDGVTNIPVSSSAPLNVTCVSGCSSGVSGDATAANQVTGNNSLSSINTKISDGTQKTQIVNSGGTSVGVSGTGIDVNLKYVTNGTAIAVGSGSATSGTPRFALATGGKITVIGSDGVSTVDFGSGVIGSTTTLRTVLADDGNQSTAALQTTANTKLDTINSTLGAPLQSGGTVTVNAGTNLNTSLLALESGGNIASIATNTTLLSQGSTTSGQTGRLVLGAVTTAAPSYTTTQTSPFSLTTAGRLRIDGSGTTQPVSGTFWQATQPISAASLPLPTGATTNAGITGVNSKTLSDVVTTMGNPIQEGGHVIVSSIATAVTYFTANITTSTTTVISSTSGSLHTVVIATRGVGSTFKCYDNASTASGTVVTGTIDTTLSTTSFTYDARLANGLTCVSTGATPADLLVSYSDGT